MSIVPMRGSRLATTSLTSSIYDISQNGDTPDGIPLSMPHRPTIGTTKSKLTSGNDDVIASSNYSKARIENETGSADGVVNLGSGDDSYRGRTGYDRVAGHDGNDRLNGLGGNDLLLGGRGDDVLDGGSGNDGLFGENGNDTIISRGGDYINGGMGADALRLTDYSFAYATGGSGIDTLVLASGSRALDLSAIAASGRLQSFERIDMAGDQRIVVRYNDIINLGVDDRALYIQTTASDRIELVTDPDLGSWIEMSRTNIDGEDYVVYAMNGQFLYVTGPGSVAMVDTPTPGASGLDAIARGGEAPLPGPETELELSPVERLVRSQVAVAGLRLEREETWFAFGSDPAIVSASGSGHHQFRIDGTLSAQNADNANAVGVRLDPVSGQIANYGQVEVQSSGEPQTIDGNLLSFENAGAVGIASAAFVQNFGSIISTSEQGNAHGIGWAHYNPRSLIIGGSGQALPGSFTIGGAIGVADNYSEITVQSDTAQGFGIAGLRVVNWEDGRIDVNGDKVAVGVLSNGYLSNFGDVSATADTANGGVSFGLVLDRKQ